MKICTSLRAIKYVCKYAFKGFVCIGFSIRINGQSELHHGEISNVCRFVGVLRDIWSLWEYKMHDRSHAVPRLLPGKQTVIFQEGKKQV